MYEIIMINGRAVMFNADEVGEEDGTYKFYLEEELVGEFEKKNIAGYLEIGDD